jgi:glycosyltransferase involved in cell wall biosynthesis
MSSKNLLSWHSIVEGEITFDCFKGVDAILLNKHISIHGLNIIRSAKEFGVKTIYDLDDWIFDLPEYSVTNLEHDLIANISNMIKESDIVSVSNAILKEKLRYLRSDVKIIGTGFDHEKIPYDFFVNIECNQPKIVFSNTDGIKIKNFRHDFFEMLIGIISDYKDMQLDFYGDKFSELNKIPGAIYKGFLPNQLYKKALRDGGYWFGITPLGAEEDEDEYEFNSCKSPVKYIDYGSLGIPGIYSNAPIYSSVIKNGENGLLVKNNQLNWRKSMEDLLNSSQMRNKIRTHAYLDCKENFNISHVAKEFLTFFKERQSGYIAY